MNSERPPRCPVTLPGREGLFNTKLETAEATVATFTRSFARLGSVLAISFSLIGWQAAVAAIQPHGSSTVKLGGVFAMTGPPSVVSIPILNGYKLAFTQANATGGVNGARIDYTTQDDSYNPSQTVPRLKTLVESDHVLAVAGVFGSDDSNAAVPYLRGKRVPFFDPIGGGANVAGDKWVWQTEPSYALEGKVIGRYLKSKKITRVAALYQQGINEPEIASLRGVFGSSHFVAASYRASDTTFTSQRAVIRGFGPQVVILLGTLVPTAGFVKESAANGYQPPKGWFANYPQGDPTWLNLTSACGCLNGSLVSSYADLTGKNPVYKAYVAAVRKYDKGQKITNYGLYGYFNGSLMLRALRLAGKKPTASRLQTIFNGKFRKYQSGFTGVLNWTPSYRYGVKQFKIYKIEGSKFIPLTGWLSK